MAEPSHSQPLVIGLTGSFGSGCEYVAKYILAPMGYRRKALSTTLRREYRSLSTKQRKEYEARAEGLVRRSPRRKFQLFGDDLRREKSLGYLAEQVISEIDREQKKNRNGKWVVRGIRNPGEIYAFREKYKDRFFLFGIYARGTTRWKRVEKDYEGDEGSFKKDDLNDTGEENEKYGQRVADCFYESDVVFSNDRQISAGHKPKLKQLKTVADFRKLRERISDKLDLISQAPTDTPPEWDEILMAMAYAASRRSNCLRRKVGAIIVRGGSVISSGYNEVPRDENPCRSQYGECHRKHLSKDLFDNLTNLAPECRSKEKDVRDLLRKDARMLDYCRALHAEENAILNLVRSGGGIPLESSCIYTTTYPCRLCAKKIATLGVGEHVYFEPYPDPESEAILRNGKVSCKFFEGVTFRAYFRIYGEQR